MSKVSAFCKKKRSEKEGGKPRPSTKKAAKKQQRNLKTEKETGNAPTLLHGLQKYAVCLLVNINNKIINMSE